MAVYKGDTEDEVNATNAYNQALQTLAESSVPLAGGDYSATIRKNWPVGQMQFARGGYADGGETDPMIEDALRLTQNPYEGQTVKPYEPTMRDRLATSILDIVPRGEYTPEALKQFVSNTFGSLGAGHTGPSLVDFTPVGGAMGAQESAREGDYRGAAMAMLPGAPALRAEGRALKAAEKYGPHLPSAEARVPENLVAPKPSSDPALFDFSRLHEVPKVEQFDLPRYEPARGVPQRVQDIVADKDVRDAFMAKVMEGQKMGGANWYNADPLRDQFVEKLGGEAGDKAFRQYMDLVAATSPRSDVGTNVRNASYYYKRLMSGEGMPEVGERNPQPYGHMAQRLHQMNAQRVAGTGWDPLNNPKPASFVENLVGNQQPVTVDTHAFRLPAMLGKDPRFLETAFEASKGSPKQNIQKMVESGELPLDEAVKRAAFWQAQPKENEYKAMENYYKSVANELGMTPAQVQASAWVGGGKLTGLASDESKPFLQFFQDRIYKTANETNMDPKDVLDAVIRGKMSLKADGGAVDGALRLARGGYADGGVPLPNFAPQGPSVDIYSQVPNAEPFSFKPAMPTEVDNIPSGQQGPTTMPSPYTPTPAPASTSPVETAGGDNFQPGEGSGGGESESGGPGGSQGSAGGGGPGGGGDGQGSFARGGQPHANNGVNNAIRLAHMIHHEMRSDPLFERKIQSILSKL